jgi:hypothetical protein
VDISYISAYYKTSLVICNEFMTLLMGDDNLNLSEVLVCASIHVIHGWIFECDLYYKWRQTVVTLGTGLTDGGLLRLNAWGLE